MKICHVITRLILGGAQENTLATVRGLVARGHDVTLVSGPSPGPEGRLLDLHSNALSRVRHIEEPHLVRHIHPWHDFAAYHRLARHFQQERYDVVHTHSSKAGIVGRLAARAMRHAGVTSVVHTIHGLAFDRYQPAALNAVYIGLERLCARHADALVSVCDTMTAQARAAGVGTDALFRTIYSGFDLDAFIHARKDRAAARTRLGIPADACVLLHVGRLFPLKGAEDFLEAVACAHHRGGRPVLGVLVGDGPLRPLLERRVAEKGLGQAVRCAGLVPPADIPCWTAAADVLVHASMREGLARAVVQALAAGVPVVTYDIGGAKEVVRDGVNGIVCAPGDRAGLCAAVADLMHDDQKRARLAAGAAATDLHRFAADFMVAEIVNLYGTLRGVKN